MSDSEHIATAIAAASGLGLIISAFRKGNAVRIKWAEFAKQYPAPAESTAAKSTYDKVFIMLNGNYTTTGVAALAEEGIWFISGNKETNKQSFIPFLMPWQLAAKVEKRKTLAGGKQRYWINLVDQPADNRSRANKVLVSFDEAALPDLQKYCGSLMVGK